MKYPKDNITLKMILLFKTKWFSMPIFIENCGYWISFNSINVFYFISNFSPQLLFLDEFSVSVCQSINNVQNGSIVARIIAMMKVMVVSSSTERKAVRQSPRPVIPAMSITRLNHPKNEPHNDCEYMYRIKLTK